MPALHITSLTISRLAHGGIPHMPQSGPGLEAVVVPRVTGVFPLVRHRAGLSAAGTGGRVVSSVEVPGCRR